MVRGRLILIEGLDRSGKSTQASILQKKLPNGILVKFPDRTTKVGGIIDQYLRKQCELSDQTAHLLFSANRWEVASSIVSSLNKGEFVVIDRYVYSGIAYSLAKLETSELGEREMGDVEWLYSPDRGLPKPDLTLFLTLPIEELEERKGWGEERYEEQLFQRKVKECFSRILDPEKDNTIEILDVGCMGIDETSDAIWKIIEKRGAHLFTESEISHLQ